MSPAGRLFAGRRFSFISLHRVVFPLLFRPCFDRFGVAGILFLFFFGPRFSTDSVYHIHIRGEGKRKRNRAFFITQQPRFHYVHNVFDPMENVDPLTRWNFVRSSNEKKRRLELPSSTSTHPQPPPSHGTKWVETKKSLCAVTVVPACALGFSLSLCRSTRGLELRGKGGHQWVKWWWIALCVPHKTPARPLPPPLHFLRSYFSFSFLFLLLPLLPSWFHLHKINTRRRKRTSAATATPLLPLPKHLRNNTHTHKMKGRDQFW